MTDPSLCFYHPGVVCCAEMILTQLKKLAEEREEAAELRSMAKRDAAKEYATKLDANEKKLKQVRCDVITVLRTTSV